MKKEDINFEGVKLQEGSETFVDDGSVKDLYDHLESETKEVFELFDTARRKSDYLASKRYVL